MEEKDYKIDSIYISRIENGFIFEANGSTITNGIEKWDTKKVYCETVDQVKEELEKIYK